MIKCDFHTHTSYCDGKSTIEEMVLSAIDKGMEGLGISGHCYTPFEPVKYYMSKENTKKYLEDINLCKEKYKDKIRLLCGTEYDSYCPYPEGAYDYMVGSAHYVKSGDDYIAVDLSKDNLLAAVDSHFGGDIYAFAEEYYRSVRLLLNKKIDIIGHLDLVTKYNEGNCLLDTNNPRYVKAVTDTIDALLPMKVPFEINTGAISRGYRKSPYPTVEILSYIKEKGGKVIFSSDAHHKDNLCYQFDIWYPFFKEKGCLPEVVTL